MEPEVLQERTQKILDTITRIEDAIAQNTREVEKVEKLSKLVTGGEKPDYSKLSDQDLRDIFDVTMRNPGLNNLPIVTDPRSGRLLEGTHPFCYDHASGMASSELSRKELIEGLDSLLKHNNYNMDPMRLSVAQGMLMNSAVATVSGYVTNVTLANINLEEEVNKDLEPGKEAYKNGEVSQKLKALKGQLKEFETRVGESATEKLETGLRKKLSSAQGSSPDEVSEILKAARQAMDNRDSSEVSKENVDDIELSTELNISGANLSGVDLSKSNLAGVKVDAETLSKARGLDKVTGADPKTLALAQAFQTPEYAKIRKNEAELDRLQTKPGFLDRLKSIFKGGIEGAKKELVDKIDKAKLQVIQKMDAELSTTLQKQNKETIQKLDGRQTELAPDALKFVEARENVKNAHVLEALSESSFGGGLSTEGKKELEKFRNENLEAMSENVKAHKEYRENDTEIGALQKNVDVRTSLRKNEKTDPEAPKVTSSHSVK
jgi:hypothetical protein